jgi:hypothetical protein
MLSTSTTQQLSCPTGEPKEMTNVRQTVLSIVVLTAFLLVLAAPFRWW